MATDAASLLAQSACFDCNGAPGQIQLMKLAALVQLVLGQNPMADVTPQGLLSQAACYNCYGSGGMWQLMELALLSQLVQSGIGNAQIVYYTGSDPTNPLVLPLNQNAAAIAVKAGSTTYTWDPVNHVWT